MCNKKKKKEKEVYEKSIKNIQKIKYKRKIFLKNIVRKCYLMQHNLIYSNKMFFLLYHIHFLNSQPL